MHQLDIISKLVLMGYHRLSELLHYWEQHPDPGLGFDIFQQPMTQKRFKFIWKTSQLLQLWRPKFSLG